MSNFGPIQKAEQLLPAVEHLSLQELDRFTHLVLQLRARKLAPSISPREATLLQRINGGLPATKRERFANLVQRREDELLTEDELCELLTLTEQEESWQVERLDCLIQLAAIRQMSLDGLMAQLGLRQSRK